MCDMIKGNESLVNFYFLHHLLITSKCFNLMQTPLQLDIWLQSYERFVNAKNSIYYKTKEFDTVFANISKTTAPTSDSFLLIMSHLYWPLNSKVVRMSYTKDFYLHMFTGQLYIRRFFRPNYDKAPEMSGDGETSTFLSNL